MGRAGSGQSNACFNCDRTIPPSGSAPFPSGMRTMRAEGRVVDALPPYFSSQKGVARQGCDASGELPLQIQHLVGVACGTISILLCDGYGRTMRHMKLKWCTRYISSPPPPPRRNHQCGQSSRRVSSSRRHSASGRASQSSSSAPRPPPPPLVRYSVQNRTIRLSTKPPSPARPARPRTASRRAGRAETARRRTARASTAPPAAAGGRSGCCTSPCARPRRNPRRTGGRSRPACCGRRRADRTGRRTCPRCRRPWSRPNGARRGRIPGRDPGESPSAPGATPPPRPAGARARAPQTRSQGAC